MAKEKKTEKPDTKGKKTKSKDDEDDAPEFKYGVQDIADELDIKPASVRVQLRNKGIEKAGKSYGWNSKSELKEVISELRAGKDDEGEKPAKKAKKDKSEKKASKDKGDKKAKKPKKVDDDD